jgi:hypothetical protein
VWTASTIDYADETGEETPDLDDQARWLSVPADGSAEGYRDIQDFIASVDDPGIADRLRIAIDGQGAFSRFRDVLQRWKQSRTTGTDSPMNAAEPALEPGSPQPATGQPTVRSPLPRRELAT